MVDTIDPDESLESWRRDLEQQLPRVARSLRIAAIRRRQAAAVWKPSGRRLSGLEELLSHLDAIVSTSRGSKRGLIIGNLAKRMAIDFETALEAGLSGYPSVASDAMRDVMEATDLILMFSTDLALIESWAETPQEVHWKTFAPSAVRKRLLKAGIKYKDDSKATMDYQAHSMAIHVGPWNLIPRGVVRKSGFLNDMYYWEIYRHAHELIFALDRLRDVGQLDWGTLKHADELADVRAGYEASMQMQAIFVALLQSVVAARRDADPDGSSGTPDDQVSPPED